MGKRITEQCEVTGRVKTGKAPAKAKRVAMGTPVDTSTVGKRAARALWG